MTIKEQIEDLKKEMKRLRRIVGNFEDGYRDEVEMQLSEMRAALKKLRDSEAE